MGMEIHDISINSRLADLLTYSKSVFPGLFQPRTHTKLKRNNYEFPTVPLMPERMFGFKISTKHKEAIRQLYSRGHKGQGILLHFDPLAAFVQNLQAADMIFAIRM
jgi:hypothetical protein